MGERLLQKEAKKTKLGVLRDRQFQLSGLSLCVLRRKISAFTFQLFASVLLPSALCLLTPSPAPEDWTGPV